MAQAAKKTQIATIATGSATRLPRISRTASIPAHSAMIASVVTSEVRPPNAISEARQKAINGSRSASRRAKRGAQHQRHDIGGDQAGCGEGMAEQRRRAPFSQHDDVSHRQRDQPVAGEILVISEHDVHQDGEMNGPDQQHFRCDGASSQITRHSATGSRKVSMITVNGRSSTNIWTSSKNQHAR